MRISSSGPRPPARACFGRRGLRKLLEIAAALARNWSSHRLGTCTVCGRHTIFLCTSIREARNNMLCAWCRSSSRKRHVAWALLNELGEGGRGSAAALGPHLAHDVYSAEANDPLHRALGASRRFICSEFFAAVAPGERGPRGVRCENLQSLTFPDRSFDAVVTEDVLEHVLRPMRAFEEIHRVLRPGGVHVFTIPCPTHTHLARPVTRRIALEGGAVRHLMPPEYHGDKLSAGAGILVATDFGTEILTQLSGIGFETDVLLTQYWLSRRHGIFDSYVFVSRKR